MDRRDFLKSIGLGAAALTLPQPLEVLAAKVADLEEPPLHVGYAAIDCYYRSTPIEAIDLQVQESLYPDRLTDLFRHWMVHIIIQHPQGFIPVAEARIGDFVWEYPGLPFLTLPGAALGFQDGDRLEIWVAPVEAPQATKKGAKEWFPKRPQFVLPKMLARLFGPRTGDWQQHLEIPIRHARVDRARAIELGLVYSSPEAERLIQSIPPAERKGLIL